LFGWRIFLSEAGCASLFLFRLGDMDKKIDKSQVKKVAKLARLELSEAEIEEFAGQLNAIIDYVERMNKLNTQGVEPMAHCLPVSNVFRDDVIKESLGTEKTLANAPQSDGPFFKVPKILEEP
jgi:aspartyl-tRNA(Asn)/glutamyl-tRNA(Gln) amidotransferase subunit C